ncbi:MULTISPECIES: stalk domain-containing protein [Paenibacillus]|uniref:stalk domain-containing protein n=1 Tax=Paenibacillus TaxID=44249 RepID=UPI0022B8D300|nr:stalk domain-containing protein [Paenibacillus caseinilyticus]MCZ8520968.1 stalk domain-containing protein [Paenibacillus caseinilyticus]
MTLRKGLKVLLSIVGACAIFTGTALASDSIDLFINGKSLNDGVKLENGKVVAPVRSVAEALGGHVTWDKETNSVNIQTELRKDAVVDWIRKQGEEKNGYYFDGLSFEKMNLDGDSEPEVLARIDGGVHLGNFFIFDNQSDGSYKLSFEQPWHVESWNIESIENFRAEGMNPLYKIVTRTGGTGVDVREVHLMYMSDTGIWTEAWKGTLKERSVFQDKYHATMGSYQFNDDDGELFYWQTEMDASLEDNKQVGDSKTTMQVLEFREGHFVDKN